MLSDLFQFLQQLDRFPGTDLNPKPCCFDPGADARAILELAIDPEAQAKQ